MKQITFLLLLFIYALLFPSFLAGQENLVVSQARSAFDNRDFDRVLAVLGKDSLTEGVSAAPLAPYQLRVVALYYESYDSLAVEATQSANARLALQATVASPNDSVYNHFINALRVLTYNDRLTAKALFQQVNEMFESGRASDTTLWLMNLDEQILNLYQRSEFEEAIERSLVAANLAQEAKSISPNQRFYLVMSAAIMHYRCNEFKGGIQLAEQCLQLANATSDPEGNRMASIHERSLMYGGLNRLEEQAADLKMLIANPEPGPRGVVRQAISRHSLARNYSLRKAYQQAVLTEEKALKVFENLRHQAGIFRANTILCESYYHIGQYDKALRAANAALKHSPQGDQITMVGDLPRLAIDSVNGYVVEQQILAHRAGILYTLGRYGDAIQDLITIEKITELARHRTLTDPKQLALSKIARFPYSQSVAVYAQLGRSQPPKYQSNYAWEAFRISEKSKAYSLAAALGGERYDWTAAERTLGFTISQLERQISRDTSLRMELANKRLELKALLTQKGGSNLDRRLSESSIDSFLTDQAATFLSYHVGVDSLYLLIKKPGQPTTIWVQDYDGYLESLVENWRSSITEGGYKSTSLIAPAKQLAYDQDFIELGLRLRRLLLPPNLDLTERIIISPDKSLNYLPFAALPLDSASLPLDYQSLDYFGDHYLISYAQSASVLRAQYEKSIGERTYDLLAVAPSFAGQAEVLAFNEIKSRGEYEQNDLPSLRPLGFNIAEVEQLQNIVGNTRVITAGAARKSRIINHLEQARILHLATHGVADTENSNFSFIAFHQAVDTLDENELLYFNELTYLPLDVDMVVLSACETNLGPILKGEGLLSMATAFTAAGAKSTLTSLWAVEDEMMQTTMADFYAGLTEGQDRTAAIHRALQLRRNSKVYAHPKYWAGLALHGVTGPIPLEAPSKYPLALPWLLGLGVMIAGGYALFKLKNRT